MALNVNEIVLDALGILEIPRGTTAERTAISPSVGDLFFDTTLSRLFVGTGSGWQLAGAIDHGELGGLSDDDHTQYLLADGNRQLSGDWDVGGTYGITGLPAPTNPSDVATKEYVDDGKTWKDQVIAIQNTPPITPTLGDRYIVLVGTGAWLGHDDDIAEWEDVGGTPQWVFETPSAGWVTFNQADGELYLYTGSAWVKWEATVDHSALTNLHTSPTTPDDHPQYLLKNTADLKVGSVASGSFAGTPKKATVTFTTAMPDANFRVFIQGEDNRNFTIESKTTAGFTINSNTGIAPSGSTYWMAVRDGEHHQSS